MEQLCHCGKKVATKQLSAEDGSILLCDDDKCRREIEDDLNRMFIESHQGRTRQNYEYSAKMSMVSIGLMFIILLAVFIYQLFNC
jgi:hypothetical protein